MNKKHIMALAKVDQCEAAATEWFQNELEAGHQHLLKKLITALADPLTEEHVIFLASNYEVISKLAFLSLCKLILDNPPTNEEKLDL